MSSADTRATGSGTFPHRNTSRLDAVAADIKVHRADTEIHHGVYRVRELQKD